ncbi:MAG: M20/M25/M40 family metallo-hydrolase [Clostridia bacterium]|nr:M20/M25/M40 family metallo-hydrolase [Clostridia bacterium]
MEYSEVRSLLEGLCGKGGVSGREDDAADFAANLLSKYMPVKRDTLGSVIGKKGEGGGIILDAHIDRIGLIVTAVKDDGFLKVAKVGGSDIRVLTGAKVTIHGKKDIFGIVTSTPPHLAKKEDEGKAPSFDDMLIDTGLTGEEVKEIVSPGDRITANGSFLTLAGTRVASPCIDDRAGVAAILRCLQMLESKSTCPLEVMFSAQEETGGSGAQAGVFGLEGSVALAVDVTFASAPGVSKEKYGSLGDGALVGIAPTLDYEISSRLLALAGEKDIKAKPEVMGGRTGTNCDEIQTQRGGIKTALISIPIRNMHTSVEVCELADIEATAALMAAYIEERSGENA